MNKDKYIFAFFLCVACFFTALATSKPKETPLTPRLILEKYVLFQGIKQACPLEMFIANMRAKCKIDHPDDGTKYILDSLNAFHNCVKFLPACTDCFNFTGEKKNVLALK